jgi:hypothetical protein
MAKPRVFISFTYYDLRNVRADLERFIKEIGYEFVLYEKGQVTYGTDTQLEEGCYRELGTCDILINIIGGKFDTESKDTQYSISQNELRTAIKQGKQIYIFVERAVHAEYRTYLANKDVKGFVPVSVNDPKIFEFLEEVYSLSGRNPIIPFEISQDITTFLKEQWACLFKLLLQEHATQKEVKVTEKIETTAETLNQLVTFLTEERSKGDQAIKDILLTNHPIFSALKKELSIPYRVFFVDITEMESLLKARWTKLIDREEWNSEEFRQYRYEGNEQNKWLLIKADLFDDVGKLKPLMPDEWQEDYVQLR